MFNTMFECFKKESMLFELIAFMERNSDGFAESRNNYNECLNMLRKELGDNATVSVDEFDAALHDAICSDLVYSAYLGFKANLEPHREQLVVGMHRYAVVYARVHHERQCPCLYRLAEGLEVALPHGGSSHLSVEVHILTVALPLAAP